ncbi:MAG: hypothetical protein QOG54_1340 [Actinomycetota bacterium]|jgi:hypothetical protein|nr:hypothetical protein [Actinomycetota bacterium]
MRMMNLVLPFFMGERASIELISVSSPLRKMGVHKLMEAIVMTPLD